MVFLFTFCFCVLFYFVNLPEFPTLKSDDLKKSFPKIRKNKAMKNSTKTSKDDAALKSFSNFIPCINENCLLRLKELCTFLSDFY